MHIFHYVLSVGCLSLAYLPSSLLAAPYGEKMAIQNTLYGLQELRTVIPERLWDEEFAVIIDRKAFALAADRTPKSEYWDENYSPTIGMSSSKYYFLYAATTGETIRLDDQYLQFLNSPYWNAPEAVRHLFYLQHNYMKVAR